jgi:1-acyl-sn-glycerol-3-phosphate acyltransferase
VVRFGQPLDFSRYEGLESDRYVLRSVTDEIMYEIMRLSGQEYVDIYAAKAKALDKERKSSPSSTSQSAHEASAAADPTLKAS